MLALFERADAGADLSFRFYFVLVQKKRPGAVRIFQPRIDTGSAGVRHRFDGRYAHHKDLILTRPFELDRRDASPLDSWAGDHHAMPTEKNRIIAPQDVHHGIFEAKIRDSFASR